MLDDDEVVVGRDISKTMRRDFGQFRLLSIGDNDIVYVVVFHGYIVADVGARLK
jgi:hypothetical protein